MSYSAGQFVGTLSQGFSAVSENNAKGMGNSGGKLTQENLGLDKSQKSSMRLVVPYGKSKQESFWVGNLVEKDLIIVGNWLLL